MNITELETKCDILKPMDVLEFKIGNTPHRFIFLIRIGDNFVFTSNNHVYEIDDILENFTEDEFDLKILRGNRMVEKFISPFNKINKINDNLGNDEFIEHYFSVIFESEPINKEITLEDLLEDINESISDLIKEKLIDKQISFSFTLQTDLINKNQVKTTLTKM